MGYHWTLPSGLPDHLLSALENKGDSQISPAIVTLASVTPNPFNPTTVIRYQLSVVSQVSLDIYDITGRLIESPLHNAWRDAGVHEVTVDLSGLVSGVYLYTLMAGDDILTGKMILLR